MPILSIEAGVAITCSKSVGTILRTKKTRIYGGIHLGCRWIEAPVWRGLDVAHTGSPVGRKLPDTVNAVMRVGT